MIILFDVPVKTAVERKMARLFRKGLLKDGFYMLQKSVYIRNCVSYDEVLTHRNRVLDFLPAEGSVRLIVMTEQQFESMEILLGNVIDVDEENSRLVVI